MDKAIIVCSGGMDSVTLAHYAKEDYAEDLHLISFDYGQRHRKELEYAARCADRLDAQHDIISLSHIRKLIGTSALTNPSIEVPEGHYADESMKQTVVPNRNMMMLAIAASIAVAEEALLIGTAVHAGDHPVYPDCRPEFIESMNEAIHQGNQGFGHPQLLLWAPFVHKSKADIVSIGEELNVPYKETWSCYKGEELHCGKCGTCVERREAFSIAGVVDPTEYQ